MPLLFHDRAEAGQALASRLGSYAHRDDVRVLGLPRGGVPVAFEVAQALAAPLDVFVVRKLGLPGQEELAMGAVASGGIQVLNDDVVHALAIPAPVIDQVAARERAELVRRERLYRGDRARPDVRGRTVIVIDDGLATGSTMKAAVRALRVQRPARIVVAVPVAARETCQGLQRDADEVVCMLTPEPFFGVGRWYENFGQTSDEEVRALLARSRTPSPAVKPAEKSNVELVRQYALPLTGGRTDYDPLLEWIGDARLVLLGEASHGTREFYRERGAITRRLIEERGFVAVAVEADWPDASRVDRYVRAAGSDRDAAEALADFRRFPTWMWRNREVLGWVEWLRRYNASRPVPERAGFYGLDLYSLRASMAAVLRYLDKVDPAAAARARARYSCFDHYGENPETYALIAGTGVDHSCEDEVVAQLVDLHEQAARNSRQNGPPDLEAMFDTEQNARLVRNAELYYRTMFTEGVSSWNVRDRHMLETLETLIAHVESRGQPARIVVWAHNSHLGDARATDRAQRGELNLGQLVRERHGTEVVLVGFTTHHGNVTAAADWDARAENKQVRPALPGSVESLFHDAAIERFLLPLRGNATLAAGLRKPLLERAIGVIYRPETERQSHYFQARVAEQFDAVIHFDETHAVEPLDRGAGWEPGEVPETYPSSL